MRTSKIQMNLLYLHAQYALVGGLVLSVIFLSVSERKFSLDKYGCPCWMYTWGAQIHLGITLCGVWHGVLDAVGDNFGLFQTESRCSNPAKFRRFVKF